MTSPDDFLESVAECPLCGSTERQHLHTVDCSGHPLFVHGLPPQKTWFSCVECGHIYAGERLNKAGRAHLFAHAIENRIASIDINTLMHGRMMWSRTVDRITELRENALDSNRLPWWIDVGCGDGMLLMTAREWGYSVCGVDARAAAIQALKKYAIPGANSEFADVDWPGDAPVGVISMCDVIEHMQDPRAALIRAREIANTYCVLYLSTPNRDTAIWHRWEGLGPGENPYWGEFEHQHIFSREAISRLLQETGWKMLRYGVSPRYKSTGEFYARIF